MQMADRPTLENFEISQETGFLPEKPALSSLSPYFSEWEKVVGQLSELLRDKQLREAVHKLPILEFSEKTLHSIEEWRRALIILSGLFQGYLWQEGEAGLPSKMPSILAVPFNNVSKKFGLPPVITYAGSALYNWHLKDPEKPISLENVYAVVNHTGTEDESWFFMVVVPVELEAVPAITAMWEGLVAREEGNNVTLIRSLAIIESAIAGMQLALNRMYEKCNPTTFYVTIRPYLAGTKGLDAFPNGIVYEGVDTKPLQYYGGSAAQSAAVKAIDIFLGVRHDGMVLQYLDTMLDYIPLKHRQFLQYLSKQPSLRQYVIDSNQEELIKQFNATVEAFVKYRSDHIILVTRYVVNQKAHTVNASLEAKGTGGTHFMKFLKSVRDNTRALLIP